MANQDISITPRLLENAKKNLNGMGLKNPL